MLAEPHPRVNLPPAGGAARPEQKPIDLPEFRVSLGNVDFPPGLTLGGVAAFVENIAARGLDLRKWERGQASAFGFRRGRPAPL
eukprot:5032340-Pyramimonas_sp.AAC.1